jgi:putative membrane protein insertion efficiency factor
MAAEVGSLPQRALIGLVRAYRLLLSASLGNACRFEPTCSRYAIDALERHGAAAGSYLALRRLGRCHPWCAGGFDPVPGQASRLFHLPGSRAIVLDGAGSPPSTDTHIP